jgi:predicted site-specific integrase-resolvase
MPQLISLKEAQKITGIKDKTLYAYVKQGLFPVYRFGTGKRQLIRVNIAELLSWIDKGRVQKEA